MIHLVSISRTATSRRLTTCGPSVKRRLGQLAGSSLLIVLTMFHSQLLWKRITTLTLFEPLVALRWFTAALLLAGFVYLRRAGVSVIWGRKALILWLLVLLCHAGAMSPTDHLPLAEPGLLFALSLWGFALRAILNELDRLTAERDRSFSWTLVVSRPPGLLADPRVLQLLSPRPPPAA